MSDPTPTARATRAIADLHLAFETWCAHQRQSGRLRRGSSEAVYRAMWHALSAWCVAQAPALRLGDLQAPALAAYLASRTGLLLADGVLTPRYQHRLLSLVRRVQLHRAWLRDQAGPVMAARAAAMPVRLPQEAAPVVPAADSGEPLLHLTPAEDQQLQRLLCHAPAAPGERWQTRRDRCAVALQLGAGLGPGDVRALRLRDVIVEGGPVQHQPWQLRVAANGSAPAHVPPLAPWAGALLAQWLQRRQAEGLGGDWLFPSTRSGKPWGKVAQYEAARRVLADAGLNADGGGSFRLRHTFALRQLAHGHDEGLVCRWLGVIDPAVMARYQRLLGAPPARSTDAAGPEATAPRVPLAMPV
jgi:integrase